MIPFVVVAVEIVEVGDIFHVFVILHHLSRLGGVVVCGNHAVRQSPGHFIQSHVLQGHEAAGAVLQPHMIEGQEAAQQGDALAFAHGGQHTAGQVAARVEVGMARGRRRRDRALG